MKDCGMNRRFFLGGGMAATAFGLAGCVETATQTFGTVPSIGLATREKFAVPYVNLQTIPPEFRRARVSYVTDQPPGTIVVDTAARHLFFVEERGKATRYGIGVGRQGFGWKGNATIQRKSEWPDWRPPAEMIQRDPRLVKYRDQPWPGGPKNPLGARALYLYQGGRDTLYRLHGTNEPRSIGKAMSSGCIRLLNQDVVHLYERTPIGTKVIVR